MKTLSKRQKIILEYIEKNEKSSIGEIYDFIKKGYQVDQRTISRDIKFILDKKLIFQKGAGRNVSYFISSQNKILKEVDVEKYFSTPFDERKVKTNFNFGIFDILKENIFSEKEQEKLSQLHNDFLNNLSKYDSQTLINKEFERILIEFSWKSSQIEGNTYSLLNTEQLIKDNKPDNQKTKEETQMILNHKDAFNESIQNKERFLKLDYSDIEYIHSVLTKDLGITKNIRNAGIGITGTKYKPLDNSFQIKEVLQEMIKLLNKKESFLEKAFLAVVLVSYIQAFEDGNKRTARMFSNAILLAYNSIPLSYRIVDVEEYKKASLLFYELNNISYFKKIFIEQFEDAVKNYFN